MFYKGSEQARSPPPDANAPEGLGAVDSDSYIWRPHVEIPALFLLLYISPEAPRAREFVSMHEGI